MATEPKPHAHHFQDLPRQIDAARLGMWLFLATEVLLFGGLFVAYALYRTLYPHAFEAASGLLDRTLGTVETLDLVTSSFFVALGIALARRRMPKAAFLCVAITIAMGIGFLVLHGMEYRHEFAEGKLPGKYYHFEGLHRPGVPIFYALYYLLTGLHSVHVIAGVSVLAVLSLRVLRRGGDGDATGIELGGLYWHLVDVIWIFLYPLLYLI